MKIYFQHQNYAIWVEILHSCDWHEKITSQTFKSIELKKFDEKYQNLHTFNVGYSIAFTSDDIMTTKKMVDEQFFTAVQKSCDARDLFTLRS